MKHNTLKYLEDVRLSIEDIESYTEKISSLTALEKNKVFFDALCRRFAVIGEALYQADKLDKALLITDKRKIIGLRHIIVHDYDLVKAPDLWKIIENKLPVLKKEILATIAQLEAD